MESKTILIEIEKGLISQVSNLPDGWDYQIIDHDVREELE